MKFQSPVRRFIRVRRYRDEPGCDGPANAPRSGPEVGAASLMESEHVQSTLRSIGDAVVSTDLAGNITYLNPAAEAMTGWASAEASGQPLSLVCNIIDENTRAAAENPAQRAIAAAATVGLDANCLMIRRDGSECAIEDSAAPIRARDGAIVGAVMVFRDVTRSRAETQRLSHLAQHDFLTGLANRMLLMERLSQAIGHAHRRHAQIGLLFLDLDHFKQINDGMGHAIGDQLLESVAARLKACVRGTDTLGRLGGDEFVMLLTEIEQPQDSAQIAAKLLAAFATPHRVDGRELDVGLSIGISIYPDDAQDADGMMRCADAAMYQAKTSGRNTYRRFRKDMNTRSLFRSPQAPELPGRRADRGLPAVVSTTRLPDAGP
jgi:diguanylate cyclase (GGDEF)-like protein/PAS domain S-box-containing protein